HYDERLQDAYDAEFDDEEYQHQSSLGLNFGFDYQEAPSHSDVLSALDSWDSAYTNIVAASHRLDRVPSPPLSPPLVQEFTYTPHTRRTADEENQVEKETGTPEAVVPTIPQSPPASLQLSSPSTPTTPSSSNSSNSSSVHDLDTPVSAGGGGTTLAAIRAQLPDLTKSIELYVKLRDIIDDDRVFGRLIHGLVAIKERERGFGFAGLDVEEGDAKEPIWDEEEHPDDILIHHYDDDDDGDGDEESSRRGEAGVGSELEVGKQHGDEKEEVGEGGECLETVMRRLLDEIVGPKSDIFRRFEEFVEKKGGLGVHVAFAKELDGSGSGGKVKER
ncbi:hypothetical protein HK102_012153, partial [Quaeritorhiza haematococci]